MGCVKGMVKHIVFLLNLVCTLVGLVLITAGSLAFVLLNKINVTTNQSSTFISSFIITLGALIFIVSFLGCWGAYQRSQCLLTAYAVIMILFFMIKLGLGIYIYTQIKSDDSITAKTDLTNQLTSTFKDYNDDVNAKLFFNEMQFQLKCCGVNGPQDYEQLARYPGTCCGLHENESCPNPTYTRGCLDQLDNLINNIVATIAYVVLGLCIIEIVAASFAIFLVRSYRNKSRGKTYYQGNEYFSTAAY